MARLCVVHLQFIHRTDSTVRINDAIFCQLQATISKQLTLCQIFTQKQFKINKKHTYLCLSMHIFNVIKGNSLGILVRVGPECPWFVVHAVIS